MILSVHILAGAAIGAKISNPYLALPIALVSHFALDALPHWEYSINHLKKEKYSQLFFLDLFKVLVDLFGGLLIAGVLILKMCRGNDSIAPLVIMAGGIIGALPDAITFLSWRTRLPWLTKINSLHCILQESNWALRKKYNPLTWGVLVEVLVLAVSVALLTR